MDGAQNRQMSGRLTNLNLEPGRDHMSNFRKTAKAVVSDIANFSELSNEAGKDKNRNIFLSLEHRSGIVPPLPDDRHSEAMEALDHGKDSTPMTSDTYSAEAAASDEIGRYLAYVAHLDMPLSAKIEMISALQRIMSSFVDSAFGDDPIHHVHESHARDEKRIPPVVSSKDTNPETDKSLLSSAFTSPAAGRERKEHE